MAQHITYKSTNKGKEQTIARKQARALKRREAAPITATVYRFESKGGK